MKVNDRKEYTTVLENHQYVVRTDESHIVPQPHVRGAISFIILCECDKDTDGHKLQKFFKLPT